MKSQLPEITSESEEGFVDLVFYLDEYTTTKTDSQAFLAKGHYQEKSVSLRIVLSAEWNENEGSSFSSYLGHVTYESVGSESDALVQVLDFLYDSKVHPEKMASQVTFTAWTLAGNPHKLSEQKLEIKLFYATDDETGEYYAELYTNIDIETKKIEIREKDPDYRIPIIRALIAS